MLHDGTFIDDVSEQPTPEPDLIPEEENPVLERLDLLIQMQLEKEGII